MPRISIYDVPPLTDRDRAHLLATTEEDIQRHVAEDGGVDLADIDSAELRVRRGYPDPRQLRHRFGMTQEEFAHAFGVNLWTLREWEQRKAEPEGSARTLLRVIEQEPEVVRRVVVSQSDGPVAPR